MSLTNFRQYVNLSAGQITPTGGIRMKRRASHISALEHLGKLVKEALFFTRDNQALQVTLTGIAIKRHVEFIRATSFPEEHLPDMVLATITIAKNCTPFVRNDNMNTIILYFAELIADFVLRQVQDVDEKELKKLRSAIEDSLRTASRDHVFEKALREPPLNRDGVLAVIAELNEHLRTLRQARS